MIEFNLNRIKKFTTKKLMKESNTRIKPADKTHFRKVQSTMRNPSLHPHISLMWQARKRPSLVLWRMNAFLGTAMLDHNSSTRISIVRCFGATLKWYPLRTLQSHVHITPLLITNPFARPMMILSKTCVSSAAWILQPLPLQHQALVEVPQC